MNTELHRHLDVSIRIETLHELARERNLVSLSESLESFREKVVINEPLEDLSAVLSEFHLFQKVLDRPEALERVAFEGIEDCVRDGTSAVELRFSPSFVTEYSRLSWEDALGGFETGMRRALGRFPGVRAGLICIASRDYGAEAVDHVADFYLRHQSRFIGMDLAGNEAGFPCRLFEKSFKKIVERGGNITVHAGEASGPENVWEAIELLGASRIGHGIRSQEDPVLMRYLRDHGICLEMCPTSNWLTRCVPSIEEHPLPRFLREGIKVSINTDDPTIFGTKLSREIELCWRKMGLSEAEIALCRRHAEDASFL